MDFGEFEIDPEKGVISRAGTGRLLRLRLASVSRNAVLTGDIPHPRGRTRSIATATSRGLPPAQRRVLSPPLGKADRIAAELESATLRVNTGGSCISRIDRDRFSL